MNSAAGDPSPDFLDALYGEESDEEVEEVQLDDEEVQLDDEEVQLDDEEVQLDDEEDEILSSDDEDDHGRGEPSLTRQPSPEPSRDRSPWPSLLHVDPLCVVVAIFDENGMPLPSTSSAPDSYVHLESAERVSGNSRGRSLRGRARGGRGERVRCRGQTGGRGGVSRHHVRQQGRPLVEISMTDDDVPPELRDMVRDIVRRRQERRVADDSDETFYDASEDMGGINKSFAWSPMESFQSVEETFLPERTGSVYSYTNPYDAFRSFWDDKILQDIVEETNRYAGQITSATFQSDWHATNAHELLCLFAFWMMMGIIRMPTIRSCFTNNPLLQTSVFSRIFTQNRYVTLNRALHFVNTSTNQTNNNAARLDPIIDHLNKKFRHNYVMSKDICIDQSLTLWKGELKFKKHMKSKAAKFGIKTFELCESATGYLWSFLVHTGKDSSFDGKALSNRASVVLKLIRPLLNKGYRLFMDNWFNSPLLARYLKHNGTDCVGPLRASRVDVPKSVTHAPLKQGELVARHSDSVCVLSWMDKTRVHMISTCHGSATGLPRISSRPPARPEPYQPQAVLDYKRSMGVDLKDQMLEPYLLERKRCARWYIKLFKRLLNGSIHNSRILLESSLKARQDDLQFRLELVHAILSRHHSQIPIPRRAKSSHSRTASFSHIVHRAHWPVRIPQTETDRAKNAKSRQRCRVCLREGRKSQRTPYQCEDCGVPLCVESCFKKFHTRT